MSALLFLVCKNKVPRTNNNLASDDISLDEIKPAVAAFDHVLECATCDYVLSSDVQALVACLSELSAALCSDTVNSQQIHAQVACGLAQVELLDQGSVRH